MIGNFGRKVDHVRVATTDRCNLRCRYCMAEPMQFPLRLDILMPKDIVQLRDASLCAAFAASAWQAANRCPTRGG